MLDAADMSPGMLDAAGHAVGHARISPSTRSGEQGLHKMSHDRPDMVSIDLCLRNELIPSHEKTRPVLEFQDRSSFP
jgi:hypothetical protein